MTTLMLLVYFISVSQNDVTDYKFIEAKTSISQSEQNLSNVNEYRLIAPLALINREKRDLDYYKKTNSYDDKEWEKIKKQMQLNKKKISYDVYISKTMDTIYLDVPVRCNNSRLSDL